MVDRTIKKVKPLRYFPDDNPGISRKRNGRGFSYFDVEGRLIRDASERTRLNALAIPPAYQDVWISPIKNGHLLATGTDEKGRKQYIYHEAWRAQREAKKFEALVEVGLSVPRLRRWITKRLKGSIEDKSTALATVLALIERGSLRPGCPTYTRKNASYGATTLRASHFEQDGAVTVLSYLAKGGQRVEKRIPGARLAAVLTAYKSRPGKGLVTWRGSDGALRPVSPSDVNEILSDVCKPDINAKALRTWNGTRAAFRVALKSDVLTKKAMAEAAAKTLHNTPEIAQKSYVHPAVMYLPEAVRDQREKSLIACRKQAPLQGTKYAESELISFLQNTSSWS